MRIHVQECPYCTLIGIRENGMRKWVRYHRPGGVAELQKNNKVLSVEKETCPECLAKQAINVEGAD